MEITTESLDNIKEILIEKGQFAFVELHAEVKPKKDGSGNNLVIDAKLVGNPPLTMTNGETAECDGRSLRTWISLTKSEKNPNPDNNVKKVAVACGMTENRRVMLEDIDEKYCKIRIGIQPARDNFAESNTIASWYPITAEDDFVAPAF